jgi:hypothetical protein
MCYTVYRIIVCSRTKIRMISSLRNFSVRILDADRFTIVVFQILDIKSNYLPGIVQRQLSTHISIHYYVFSDVRFYPYSINTSSKYYCYAFNLF